MEVLQVENLSFKYPNADKSTLDKLSFKVRFGEFVLLCGASGSGKTTLLSLIKKEISPSGEVYGRIVFDGCELSTLSLRQSAEGIGFVMQDPELQIVTDTVWHELAFGLENLGIPTDVIRRRVAEMSEFFGISGLYNKKTYELSGGEKQLLNLAAVMVMQPKLLILDEPTAQLDPIAAADFLSALKKLNTELGLTIILSEHRLEEIFPLADRVLVMDNGELIADAPPKELHMLFKNRQEHPICEALPTAVKLFSALKREGESPLTVREGRAFIIDNYKNDVLSLPEDQNTDPSGEVLFRAKNLFYRYERNLPDVLKDCNLTAYKGEHLAVLGGNGAGKTTLIKNIAGILRPYRGKVVFADKEQTNSVGVLPQNPSDLFLGKTVKEELLFAAELSLSELSPDKAVDSVIKQLELEALKDRHPMDISGGELQRCALAILLLKNCKLFLLDEPTKGMDALSKRHLGEIISALISNGATVVTVTHDVEFAAKYADRCAMFFDGQVLSEDLPSRFFENNNFYTTAANRMVRGFYKNAVLTEQVIELCKINGELTDE